MLGERLKAYLLVLKIMLLGFVFFNTFQAYSGNSYLLVLYGAGVFMLALNDTVRYRTPNAKTETVSLLLSIAGAALMKYDVPGIGTTVYILVPLFELFYLKRTGFRLLLLLHVAAYFIVLLFTAFPSNEQNTATLGTSTLLYLGVACASWLLRVNRHEQEEIIKLNEDLTESNKKLVQYAREAEELTIIAERSRVAQELHDSLGHSLMALSMHLDYADKISDTEPELAKTALGKARELSKKSAAQLRNAVEALKEFENTKDLRDSITELARSFTSLDVDVRINLDSALGNANADIKNCIYKTAREALTNGLKHGSATAFDIQADLKDGIISFQIQDNGSGCERITESTGLQGIRSRIRALGGSVSFNGGRGFTITAIIPLLKEEIHND